MRWTKRKYRLKDKKGESRIVKRFLILPTSFNGTVRWLEMADIVQQVIKKKGYKWTSIDFKK